jgi:hypothetical protein
MHPHCHAAPLVTPYSPEASLQQFIGSALPAALLQQLPLNLHPHQDSKQYGRLDTRCMYY